jgi:hypothetical protein
VIALVLVMAGGAAAALSIGLAGSRPAAIPRRHVPTTPKPNPAQQELIANEQATASWVAGQVAPGTPVTCDPAMCGYLALAGWPSARQLVASPGAGLPPAQGLVVATSVLRAAAGAQLATEAPEVIAAFGTGQVAVEVLVRSTVITRAAFLANARNQTAASGKAGRALIRRGLHVRGGAQQELITGRVDRRLEVLLARILKAHPVYVTTFGDAGPGASWPAPLRSVTIDRLVRVAGKHRASGLSAVLQLLRRQPAPYRTTLQQVRLSGGRIGLVIEVLAPGQP